MKPSPGSGFALFKTLWTWAAGNRLVAVLPRALQSCRVCVCVCGGLSVASVHLPDTSARGVWPGWGAGAQPVSCWMPTPFFFVVVVVLNYFHVMKKT